MGKYLNIGLDGFASLRNGNYIDKSMLISYINDNLNTPDNLICVSRPRRFGKSSAIKMLIMPGEAVAQHEGADVRTLG